MKVAGKNTVTVTRKIAEAFGSSYDEEKRAGVWGFTIGNMWATTRKELHKDALNMLEVGASHREDWRKVLEQAQYPREYDIHGNSFPMFLS